MKKIEKNKNKRSLGFTLIELIVVMATIGILVLLAAPKFLGYTERARENKHIHTAKVIETALEAYLINGGAFPDDLEVVDITLLNEAATNKSLIGVSGYIETLDDEIYYELTYDFIQKIDVKLSANNDLFVEAMASSVPTAVYASEKGIALVDKEKTMKGYELTSGDIPNEINPDKVKELAVGGSHSLALMNDGSVVSWGRNEFGQLGDGTATKRLVPVEVIGLTKKAVSIAAGTSHSIALLEDGSVMTWGDNTHGQLGDGSTSNKKTPTAVINISDEVKSIASGNYHTLALLKSGRVISWGYNYHGQLGDGTTSNKRTAVEVIGLTDKVLEIKAGNHQSLSILEDGSVMTWGLNNYGQLGDGSTLSKSIPVELAALKGKVKSIEVGGNHSMALLKNGDAMSWGYNNHGQLGDGTKTNMSHPTKVIGLTNNIADISLGVTHSSVLLSDGSVMAWGRNSLGQLGDGTTINSPIPVKVIGLTGKVKKIISKINRSFAIIEDGSIMAWGYNFYGELGDGTTDNKIAPVIIHIP